MYKFILETPHIINEQDTHQEMKYPNLT